MPNDLSIEQINQHTNVMPSVLDLSIRQSADDEVFGFLLLELSVQNIPRRCFITSGLMGLILRHGVGGNESLLFHNTTNSTSGDDESAFLELDFDLSCTVSFSIFVENLHNQFGYIVFVWLFFRFIVKNTSCDLQDVAHC
ncbi:hypothetical protein EDM60_14355 [Brevibacillus parabrevis]|nr:hypothetical protein EDM60_14355 [Brevibacillus parabrevis]